MTLLSICQEALEEISEFEVPSSFVGNANQTAKLTLRLANKEGLDLKRRYNWHALGNEATFSTVATQDSYTFTEIGVGSDFERFVPDTWWNRTQTEPMWGPASRAKWQKLKSGLVVTGLRQYFLQRNEAIEIWPTPTAVETIAFEWQSTLWCESSLGVGQSSWQADTDVGRLDEELMRLGLIWRFLKAKGLPYQEEFNTYEHQFEILTASDGGSSMINMGAPPDEILGVNTPDGSFG